MTVVKSAGTPTTRTFYARDAVAVARELVGAHIVRVIRGERLVVRIVECEAYRDTSDAASHAYRGRTERNAPMFDAPGHAYVYFIYGMHWMFNIVAHPPGEAGAILVRAAEPLLGIETMWELRGPRFGKEAAELTNGPAKLAQALAITGRLSAVDLCIGGEIYVVPGALEAGEHVVSGPRVRVPGDESAKARPWRFWIHGNAFVSR